MDNKNLDAIFHTLKPGQQITGEQFKVPLNIEVGENCKIDSAAIFKNFFSKLPTGLKLGNHITLFRSYLATEENGYIEIGDYSYLSNAAIVCSCKILIGQYVYIAAGVTIVDSDFHPASPAARLADTVAVSPVGDRSKRPSFNSYPVIIEDDVWIGYNATILKGVTIGKGAVVQPGAVVSKNVPAGVTVAGNPAVVLNESHV